MKLLKNGTIGQFDSTRYLVQNSIVADEGSFVKQYFDWR